MPELMALESEDRELDTKRAALRETFADMERVLVAYSGGVDSAFLLWAALDALGPERVLAVTASSPIFARRELRAAEDLAHRLGAPHRFVRTMQLEDADVADIQVGRTSESASHLVDGAPVKFATNPPERCYLCKREIFARLVEVAREEEIPWVVEGSNLDDRDEYRPGTRAVRELDVRSPLEEVGLTKADIRALSRRVGLPTWNQPAQTCLATRFPHGTPITRERLERVEAAEVVLREMGFGELRVRDHVDPAAGPIARIEVLREDVARLARPEAAERVVAALRGLGYDYVTLDLGGYRRGGLSGQVGEVVDW